MWCRDCAIETNEKNCPICGRTTEEDTPIEIMWCSNCRVPIIRTVNDPAKCECPLCSKQAHYLSADLRPVFPEERLLLEFLLDKNANEFIDKSVWASNGRYYIDGMSVTLASSVFQKADTDLLIQKLEKHTAQNSYESFNKHEDLRDLIGDFISSYTHPELYEACYICCGSEQIINRKAALTGLLSAICDKCYARTPVVNNEALNRNEATSMARNSRLSLKIGLDRFLSMRMYYFK